MDCVLGIDCGNKSLKAILLSKDKEVVGWVYLENLGVIKTLRRAFIKLSRWDSRITGVGVCGAGRQFTSRLLDADCTRTEIVAFYRGCKGLLKEDSFTAMDIGGEDCKILKIEKGLIGDFVMNNLCSANLGVYLESVAHRLGIKIEDFGQTALKSNNPLTISSKCGVFGISSCVSLLNQGARIEDILSGVARSLVRNYLSMYRKKLTPPFVFAGGVALNQVVCYWLRKELGCEVLVPEKPLILSAIGVATLAMESCGLKRFSLDEFLSKDLDTKVFNCEGCENNCQITQLMQDGKPVSNFGSRCGKWQ